MLKGTRTSQNEVLRGSSRRAWRRSSFSSAAIAEGGVGGEAGMKKDGIDAAVPRRDV